MCPRGDSASFMIHVNKLCSNKKTSDSMIVVVVLLMMAGDAGWALFG